MTTMTNPFLPRSFSRLIFPLVVLCSGLSWGVIESLPDSANFYDDPTANDLSRPFSQTNDLGKAKLVSTDQSAVPPRPQCAQATTLTFCLDDSSYPSADIEKEIKRDYGTFYKMYAEVSNQSTSSLVEGVPADQEAKYDFGFYYGTRDPVTGAAGYGARANPPVRADYYKDGGYLCPAFIDYSGVLRATNARGEWQMVVNIKPWLQTVRLEQCFYPQRSCSYVSKAIQTSCVQKYSYQRLIAYEPQGRGIYTDVFRLPTSCSCYIKPSQKDRDKSTSFAASSPAVFQVEATQNVNTRTRVDSGSGGRYGNGPPRPDDYQVSGSQGRPDYYGARLRPSSDQSSADSPLVEKRRLREQGLSLGDLTNDPEVDLAAYSAPEESVSRVPQDPRFPPPHSGGPPRGNVPFALDEGPSGMQGDASRVDPAFFPPHSNMPDNGPPSDNNGPNYSYSSSNSGDRRRPGPSQDRPPPGYDQFPGPPNGPPGPGPYQSGPPGPGPGPTSPDRPGFVLGPVMGPYGPPAPTYRPLGSSLTFYDYNMQHRSPQQNRPSRPQQQDNSSPDMQ